MTPINVFVTVGTHTDSFHRLVSYCLDFFNTYYMNINLTVQYGYTSLSFLNKSNIPNKPTLVNFFPRIAQLNLIKDSDVIITHAGIGTINECFNFKKKPIIVPRFVSLGEHTDPSQVEIGNFFKNSNLAFNVEKLPTQNEFYNLILTASKSKIVLDNHNFKENLMLQIRNDINTIISLKYSN